VGPDVVAKVAELYAARAVVVAYQLAPAALLLAAGACVSTLRQRRETTAMAALTVSPGWLYAGIGAAGAAVIGLSVLLDPLIGRAGERADRLQSEHFHQWGDFSTYFGPRQWFRGGDRIYFLRHALRGGAFGDISIFTLSSDVRLARRVDAEEMQPQPDGSWRLLRGAERDFPSEGESHLEPFEERVYRFPERPDTFAIRFGRPEQIPFGELREEVERRKALGLPAATYEFALYNKLAYPLLGLPAALLAAALAMRRNRSGHLTTALMEGVAVVAALWGASVVFKSAASNGHLDPAWAAWAPVFILGLASAVAIRLTR
jgi:lipopolysaccharide export system permease protein